MTYARPLAALVILLAFTACMPAPPPPRTAPSPKQDSIFFPAMPEAPEASALLIPVEGIRPQQLRDSFYAPRSGGRIHAAIDIMAPRGTPVLAVADGTILQLHQGPVGGITVYQLDLDGRTRYYYAHLDRYASGLRQGEHVQRGQVIGYVGDTGNAAPGDYHLHFSIAILDDPRRWWEGRNLNPYPLLKYGVPLASVE
jgi:peptidoglycan LD-endopeptidase LytH